MTNIVEKLQNVIDRVTGNDLSPVNIGMSVPADPECDLDLIAAEAIKKIERLEKALTTIADMPDGENEWDAVAKYQAARIVAQMVLDEDAGRPNTPDLFNREPNDE